MTAKTSSRGGRPPAARIERLRLASLRKLARAAKDVKIINRNAERLNAEAADVLRYQRIP